MSEMRDQIKSRFVIFMFVFGINGPFTMKSILGIEIFYGKIKDSYNCPKKPKIKVVLPFFNKTFGPYINRLINIQISKQKSHKFGHFDRHMLAMRDQIRPKFVILKNFCRLRVIFSP